ncbi:MAG: 3-hydroxyacyl-CoA dehydrogenase family protein [Clostridiales Family XIII bacterium]|jgi:3-hydroxybutyryl-CoA dehydrogenase|nr:3-hydroxyacyl-CoA dehydrogenase family protein [Clostridiales Family XIII bacterium]
MSAKIGIIGAGNMGKGLTLLFAMRGFPVTLYTRDLAKEPAIREAISGNIKLLSENEVISAETAEAIPARISFTDSYEVIAAQADLIIENVVEDLGIKRALFAELDRLAKPDVILSSNTSAISITEIGQDCVNHRERVIGTHFWNPPYLVPLVEVIETPYSSPDAIARATQIMEEAKKVPVLCHKDVPGFVANRLQHALQREALNIVARGIASPEDVDKSIKYGFGMRLGICPPLEVVDMGGTDLTLSIHEYLFPDLYNEPEPVPILKEMVARGDLGFKSGKGVRAWTEDEIRASRENLTKGLIAVLRALDRL